MKTTNANPKNMNKIFNVQAELTVETENFWRHFALVYLAKAASQEENFDNFKLPRVIEDILRDIFQGDIVLRFPDSSTDTYIKYVKGAGYSFINMITVNSDRKLIIDCSFRVNASFRANMHNIGRYLGNRHYQLIQSFDKFGTNLLKICKD